ncbi:hypothetical protein [Parasporobacterium paucivorans]|uniref:Uncharacterized protein n=1 Tax=Parasporobacterium paucivorans DSM 15970 TaxID=1122934 RepID=A0A1M6JFK5_9FIRM|nr:hypothetical protein [Parasporobacterium paucivorans]SHJ45463.1 hypothetical protein SAMN02745691_01985 [Parasporobacterium paucivorans DSM 15970]
MRRTTEKDCTSFKETTEDELDKILGIFQRKLFESEKGYLKFNASSSNVLRAIFITNGVSMGFYPIVLRRICENYRVEKVCLRTGTILTIWPVLI